MFVVGMTLNTPRDSRVEEEQRKFQRAERYNLPIRGPERTLKENSLGWGNDNEKDLDLFIDR